MVNVGIIPVPWSIYGHYTDCLMTGSLFHGL